MSRGLRPHFQPSLTLHSRRCDIDPDVAIVKLLLLANKLRYFEAQPGDNETPLDIVREIISVASDLEGWFLIGGFYPSDEL